MMRRTDGTFFPAGASHVIMNSYVSGQTTNNRQANNEDDFGIGSHQNSFNINLAATEVNLFENVDEKRI
jgi:hypothetical protein